MALERWLFLYTAPGVPAEGRIDVVQTAASTTTLAGFPSTDTAMSACRSTLRATVASVQLVELCGAFDASHVVAVRGLVGTAVPIGLVAYTGDMVGGLHRLFGS